MYTIKQAAVRSGVNVALLRAWERRYGIVAPSRTDAGYRLYDDEAIERLRAMRTLVDDGWSASQAAARVTAAEPAELDEITAGSVASLPDAEDTTAAFVQAAVRIDGEGLERALDDMFARGSFERIVEDRLYPSLHALGDAWETGEVDVAGEHAASSAALRRLAMAFEAAGGSGGDRPVLVGLPPGARHEIASLAFATAARRAGIPVVYLGPDVPTASWVAAAERTEARAVAMGIVRQEDIAGGDAVVGALRASNPALVIAIGGRRGPLVGNGGVVQLPDGLDDAVAVLRAALS